MTLAALLTLMSTEGLAANLQYRVFNPGVKAKSVGETQPSRPGVGVGGGGAVTTPSPDTGTTPAPDSSTVPPVETPTAETPAPVEELPFAKSGVQFLLNGVPLTSYALPAGGSVKLTLRNTSDIELRGWLRTSAKGLAYADMAGTVYLSRAWCAQEEPAGYAVVVKAGKECLFWLRSNAAPGSRPADTFTFVGLDNVVIPNALSLLGE